MSELQTATPGKTGTASPNKILIVSGLGLLFDSMDVALLAFVLASLGKEWHLAPGTMGFLGSISLIGMAVGSFLAGLFADRFGRKSVFLWTLLIYSLASGLTAFATGVGIFIALRLLVGIGLGGELPVATTYVLESSPEAERGRRVVWLEAFWAGGSLLASIISFFVVPSIGWRVVFLIGALPALYTLVLRATLPETPKFRAIKEKQSMGRSFATIWQAGIRRGTLVTMVLWFTMNFGYYGMFTWLPTILNNSGYSIVKSIGYVLIMTLAQVPGYLTAAWLVEKWGRKRTLTVMMFFAALSALGFGFAHSTTWIIVFGLLLSFFMLGGFGGTYIFTVEQFPTTARATGFGWSAGVGRIGGIIAPFITGMMIGAKIGYSWIFGLFFLVTLLGFLVVSIWGRETKGNNME